MAIKVLKFGGSSVADVERIRHVAKRVQEVRNAGNDVVVVVSAMGDTTDHLLEMANQLTNKPSTREMDMLLATGEQVSISLLAIALQHIGIEAVSLTGWQAGIETNTFHGRARMTNIDNEKIRTQLADGKVVVVAGFQGITPQHEITTLGRGGSDTTAVALAAALEADSCHIFTDVTGVYTADPRVVSKAQKLDNISYDEMLELATLGAVVLHPRAVECAKIYGVELVVRSTFMEEEGTIVKEEAVMEKDRVVRGVAHDLDVTKIKVLGLPNEVGMLSRLFTGLAKEKINVDIIVQSEHGAETNDISFSIEGNDTDRTVAFLQSLQASLSFESINVERNLAKVSIVGAGMITNPGVAALMFDQLSTLNIPIKMVSTSEIKVSCVVPKEKAIEAVQALHKAYELDLENVNELV